MSLNKPRQISTDEFLKHPGTKKLCNAVKSLVHDIEEQSSNANNITTQNKIKYLQKIKEENNFLKKELVSLFKENRRLSEAKGDDESHSKNIKLLESQLKKVNGKLEAKHKEMKLTIKNVNKMCDYILSRPLVPQEMRECSNDNLKIKQAIQAVGYMSKYITEKDKEMTDIRNKGSKLEELLKASNEERNYLRAKVDSLIPSKT